MSEPAIAAAYVLELRQHFTPMQNRYDVLRVDGSAPQTIAYTEQKRFSLKEKVSFWSGKDKTEIVFTVGARNVVDLAGTYDVLDPAGAILATVKKDVVASFVRSTFNADLAGGVRLVAQERSLFKSLLRRLTDFGLPIHFDWTTPDGRVAMSIERSFMVRDVYRVTVRDQVVDWRVAAALAVATDAFMNR